MEKNSHIREEAINFLQNNKDKYGILEFDCIMGAFKCYSLNDLYLNEFTREILDELGFIPDDFNIYKEFFDIIDNVHKIDGKNVVEIGGGIYSRLAKIMSLKQKNGTITVYDPRLSDVSSSERLIMKKEKLGDSSKIDNCDLLVGLMPCEGAEVLIDLALKNKIDFVLWLCEGGPHGDEFDFYDNDVEWRASMIDKAQVGVKMNGMGELNVKVLSKFSKEYPIIYNKK